MVTKEIKIYNALFLALFCSITYNADNKASKHAIKIEPFYPDRQKCGSSTSTGAATTNPEPNNEQNLVEKNHRQPLHKPEEWLLESSLKNAPKLLHGILAYLRKGTSYDRNIRSLRIPSFHRFILLGPPGCGKTTTAHAIAYALDCSIVFTAASTFLGSFRNQTANNLHDFFKKQMNDQSRKVIIIDELHKLFEHFASDKSDDSQSAAAFWLILDALEKYFPNIIVIGTANNVDQLPPEIKSRFSGKVITIPLPTKKQKIEAFRKSILNDRSVVLDESIDKVFIEKAIQQIPDCSLRNIQLLIDTAKMYYCAENCMHEKFSYIGEIPIFLTASHFQQALDQLAKESQVLESNLPGRISTKLQPWSPIFSTIANICVLIRACMDIPLPIISKLILAQTSTQ